jgi:hypothetical protein
LKKKSKEDDPTYVTISTVTTKKIVKEKKSQKKNSNAWWYKWSMKLRRAWIILLMNKQLMELKENTINSWTKPERQFKIWKGNSIKSHRFWQRIKGDSGNEKLIKSNKKLVRNLSSRMDQIEFRMTGLNKKVSILSS